MQHRALLSPLFACALLCACGDPEPSTTAQFDVPSEAVALQSFLDAGDYLDFPAESGVHAGTNGSPHGQVRVFINPTLEASLASGADAHPAGSAAIKELYDGEGSTLIGWAVSLKTEAESEGGIGWYWYEQLDGNVVVDGNGETGCTGCHIGSGTDLVAIDYPLQ